ncbi:putative quinol monooxygenase [Rhodococcus sp. T2V]|uniref:putative quinol monooxygenase n=1 Tax=Rhodococcus sp. T2V TaxID=3034164 RepID=UPI0023E259C7|nr:putative quinol monooxygenase [Rhodococcus sp. T2V]MDF3313026.1 putative quinol monooxygenase [Rhodococcus sp. T2V]
MIFIVVKFKVLPNYKNTWLSITREFSTNTRAEEGNLWYQWSRSVDHDDEYILVEAFRDSQAGEVHVASEHFRKGLEAMRPGLAETPHIIHTEIPGTDWSRMSELAIGATSR